MQIIDKKLFIYKVKEVHFSDTPFDINGCDFLYFPFCTNKVEKPGFMCYNKLTSIIDLTQDIESIWNNINRNTRRIIRNAEKEDIEIVINQGFKEFYKIYRDFLRKKDINSIFEPLGLGFIPLSTIDNNGKLFIAKYHNEILVGHVFLENKYWFEDWVTGSKRLDNSKKNKQLSTLANRLILWEAIKYAKEQGFQKFDLGGLFPKEKAKQDPIKHGINRFKLSFGGDIIHGYTYDKIYSKTLQIPYYLRNLKNNRVSLH
jgi:lipid II:glycine glycyltransferase (peptidoglycan interpeptide bridge formation enzyme)